MSTAFRFLGFLFVVTLLTACGSPAPAVRAKRPHIYQGGQYYGDALHSSDLQPHN